jgi:hypothetical protein
MSEAVLEISASQFKAKCLALFKELEARRYDRVVVTRRGKPIAELRATPPGAEIPDLYGAMKGSVTIPPGVDLTEPLLEDVPEAWSWPRAGASPSPSGQIPSPGSNDCCRGQAFDPPRCCIGSP